MRGRRTLLLAALLLSGVVLARDISLDYDGTVDFSALKTYDWKQGTPAANQNVDRAIVEAVDAQLQAVGLKRVHEKPDVYALYNAVLRQEATRTDYDYGKFKFRNRDVVVQKYTTGTLVVELVDAGTEALLWRATATDTVGGDPGQTQEQIPGIVKLMFRSFPPKKAT